MNKADIEEQDTCEECGQRKPDVKLQSNYDSGEFDPGELFMLCENCAQDAIQKI